MGINIGKTPLLDAAGVNDDFPLGRGVFIDDNREFVVLVNFEDHVQIIMLPGQELKGHVCLRSIFGRLEKVNHAFARIGYATDPYLGYLTVNPTYLGTGMAIEGSYKLSDKQSKVFMS